MKKTILQFSLALLPGLCWAQQKQAVTVNALPPLNKGYSQAVIAEGRLLFIAGQVPVDSTGRLVGKNDFSAQVERVFGNIELVVKASGGSMNDLVKINYHIVGLDPARLAAFRAVAVKHKIQVPPAATLIGVQSLYDPDVLIEVDAVAVLSK